MESCDICSRSFNRRSGLLSHKESKHHRLSFAISWTCDIGLCRRSFGKESSLLRHKEDKHATATYEAEPSTSSDGESDYATDFGASTDMKDFLDRCEPADVHRYISDHLQPDESYSVECSSVVEHLANFFQRNAGFTVNRFIKGGSLGKGTAIKSKSDVDLVMFISELPPIGSKNYKEKLQEQLDELENTLQRSKLSIAFELEVVGRTNHAVKLRVQSKKADREPHDVDLLLTSDLLGPVPTDAKKEEAYMEMGRMDERSKQNCSAALVELQRDFVKQQSAEVKDLIRLVKMWKKSCGKVNRLTSYSLELLCIHVWDSLPIFSRNVASAFQSVLRKLSDYRSIKACWDDNYLMSMVPKKLAKKRPLILDPANPYNNVAGRCKARDWPEVAQAARETLMKPFFN